MLVSAQLESTASLFSCPPPTESRAARDIRCYQHCRFASAAAKGLSYEFTVKYQDFSFLPFFYCCSRYAHITKQIGLVNVRKTEYRIGLISDNVIFVQMYKTISVHAKSKNRPSS